MGNGPNRYDLCDVCAGNNQACRDCAECGECNGDGTSCICDGAMRVEVCNFPMVLLDTECVVNFNEELIQETWWDPATEVRSMRYMRRITGEEVFNVNTNNLSGCECSRQ